MAMLVAELKEKCHEVALDYIVYGVDHALEPGAIRSDYPWPVVPLGCAYCWA